MTKITPEHLARSAFVYIRQSTTDQLLHNHESRRRQYALAERARALGWTDVTIIDSDLGRSALRSVLGSKGCCWRFAKGALGPCCRSRPPACLAMVVIGTRSSSFVA